jgi:acyl-CoA synthetase (AMP-forming)/AMP-acid ligase II
VALNWLRRTTYSVVETRARVYGTDVAVIKAGASLDPVTYAELHDGIRRRARMLAGAGVTRGTHVAIWADNSIAWLESWLANSLLGSVTVALNPRLTAREAGALLTSTDVTHVLSDASHAEALLTLERGTRTVLGLDDAPRLDSLEALDADFKPAGIDGDRIGLIQFTSGSTGLPKGVQLREGSIAALGACCADRWLLRPDDRFFGVFSLAHNAGTTFSTMPTFTAGAALILPSSGWARGAGAEVIERAGATVLPGVDTIVKDLLASGLRPRSLRLVVGGFDRATTARVAADLGVEVSNTYGLSECTANITVGDLRDSQSQRTDRIGLPHPGNRARIVGEDGTTLEPNTPGEIQVDGWVKMTSYYGLPDDQQPFSADGWVRTGDLGTIDEHGYISFLGRSKDVIRSGGENVAAFEIERFLETHPGVLQAVVVAAPHPRFGEVPYAFVLPEPGAEVTGEALADFCRGQLATFKIPKHWELVEHFPLVGINKVSKPALKLRAAEAVTEEQNHG